MKKNILIVIGSLTEQVEGKDGSVDSVTSATKRMGDSTGESTMEIGLRMKYYFENKNINADIIRSEDPVPDLNKYNLIIIGSSIEGGIPKASVKRFIDENRVMLSEKKVAVFAACGGLYSSRKGTRDRSMLFADKAADDLIPVSKAVFAGKNPDMGCCLNLLAWRIVLGTKKGDQRDWEEIEKWTISLTELL